MGNVKHYSSVEDGFVYMSVALGDLKRCKQVMRQEHFEPSEHAYCYRTLDLHAYAELYAIPTLARSA